MGSVPPAQRAAGHISEKSARTTLVLSVGAAVVTRGGLLGYFVNFSNPVLWEFGVIARNLVEEHTYAFFTENVPTAFLPPGFPLLIALFYSLVGVTPAAHIILATFLVLVHATLPLLAWLLVRDLWGYTAAATVSVLVVVWPQLLLMAGRLNPLPIYSALLMLACLCILKPQWSPIKRAIWTGLTLGIYSLFRFDGLAFAAFFGLLLFLSVSRLKSRIIVVVVFGFCTVLPLSPWIVRNIYVFDRVVLATSSGYNLLRGHHPDASGTARRPWSTPARVRSLTAKSEGTRIPGEEERLALGIHTPFDELANDKFYRDRALEHIWSNPLRTVELTLWKLYYFLVADFTHPIARRWYVWLPSLAALVLGGFWWFRRGLKDISQWLLWSVFAVQMVLAAVFFVLPRYRMTVEFIPLLFLGGWLAGVVWPKLLPLLRR